MKSKNCLKVKGIVGAFILATLAFPAPSWAREQLRIVGSSTAFPFVAAAAEQFGRAGMFRTPIVEATGTGGGIKIFCGGVGENFPDMVNASRTMKLSEREICAAHGAKELTEIKIGYDGIVLANARDSRAYALTRKNLFLALARDVPKNGKMVTNFYRNWSDIDPALPHSPIKIYGPPTSSGTRDSFVELVMIEGCKMLPEVTALFKDEKLLKQQCSIMREDGAFLEAGEDDNLIVQKLKGDPDSVGIFGYSFLESNAAQVKANPVDGEMPSYEAIEAGRYHISRSLFVYVKNAHADRFPGLREFAMELASDAATGEEGYLIMKGLLPLNQAEHQAVQRIAKGLIPMQ